MKTLNANTRQALLDFEERLVHAPKKEFAGALVNFTLGLSKADPKPTKAQKPYETEIRAKVARIIRLTGSQATAPKGTKKASAATPATTFVELTDEQRKAFNAQAKAHADATVGHYGARVTRAQKDADPKAKAHGAKPGYRMALRAEFKRLCQELADA